MNKFVFVVLCALLVGEVLGEAALGNYYKDVVREQHELINEMNQNFTELEKASEKLIDLGLYVGKHKLPPKTIKITKTVAVKVPVPFPVKVPEPVPVPVPVSKPVPVPVPTLVAIPIESTAATVAAVTVTGSESTSGPTPPSPSSSSVVPADADPASSQVHPSTVQVQDWKNISSSTITTSTTNDTNTTSTPPATIRNSRSIINVIQRKRDRSRARNSTTGDTGAAGPAAGEDKDSTMSVVLKFKPMRIRLQSSDLSLMRINRRPSRMTSGTTSSSNTTRPRTPVPRIRPIPLRQATPEANLRRLRHRESVKATTTPASTSSASSSSSSSSSSEESREANLSSSLSNSVESWEEAAEDASVEQRSEESLEESRERELLRKPARTRTSSSARVRHSSKRPTKRPRYRDSKGKHTKRDSKRHSKRDSRRDSKRHSKRHSKRDSKRHAKRNSKRSKTPKKEHTIMELVVKPKKATTSRPVHSNSHETRTHGTRSPILHATTPISLLATTTTTQNIKRPNIFGKVVPGAETVPAASSPKATITHLSPSRTDLAPENLPGAPPFLPPKHTVIRHRGNGPRRNDPHLVRAGVKPHHANAAPGRPSYQLQQQFGEHAESPTGASSGASPFHHNFHHHHHIVVGGYDPHAEHEQHDQFGPNYKGSYGSGSAKLTVHGVPSDAHLYPGYNAAADHDNHGTNHGGGTSGKFHYHFHNVHPIGGGGADHQLAASEHQYHAVDAEPGRQYGGAAGPDGSRLTSYDPPASGSTFHFHDDATDDMFAGASDVQERIRAPYEEH
uniref:Uncharacterized protein n=1 Tax=Anopheles farauti TaxID=69004 RepID=A0A182Q623_9DIPT